MKIKLLFLLLFLTGTLFAGHLKLGVAGGYAAPHGDFAWGWQSSAAGGIIAEFQLDDLLPVEINVIYSHHDRILAPEPSEMFHASALNVHLIQVNLNAYPISFKLGELKLAVLGGFTSTMFISTNNWPPETNSDESEIGFNLGGSIDYTFADDFTVFLRYTWTGLLTEPKFIKYSTVYSGLTFDILGRKAREENQ